MSDITQEDLFTSISEGKFEEVLQTLALHPEWKDSEFLYWVIYGYYFSTSPIGWAIWRNMPEMIELLIGRCDVNANLIQTWYDGSWHKSRPIDMARMLGHKECVGVLEKYSAMDSISRLML